MPDGNRRKLSLLKPGEGLGRIDVRPRCAGPDSDSKLNPAQSGARTGELTLFDQIIDCLGRDQRNVKGFAALNLFLQTRG